jgi:hypothetical protein
MAEGYLDFNLKIFTTFSCEHGRGLVITELQRVLASQAQSPKFKPHSCPPPKKID